MPRTLVMISVFAGAWSAQQKVPPGLTYHRVLAGSPLVGTGNPGTRSGPCYLSHSDGCQRSLGRSWVPDAIER
jgi:hypothetical protein